MRGLFIILTLLVMVAAMVALLCGVDGAAAAAIVIVCVCCAMLLILLLVRGKKCTVQPDNDEPDGSWFPSMLIEIMDTISRGTAERPCGIDTQMLYEQARFCEPCEDISVRPLEREILTAITEMHPDDSNEELSRKCRVVLKKLEERRKFVKNIEKQKPEH